MSAGFDAGKPANMVSTGVSIYLTRDANTATLREVAGFAQGSTLAMTFLLPLETADHEVRAVWRWRRGERAQAERRLSASSPRRRCLRWPATPASQRRGTSRLLI